MGKYVLILAAIVFIGLLAGFLHYLQAAPSHVYSGDMILTRAELDEFVIQADRPGYHLVDFDEYMTVGDRTSFSFKVLADEPGFDYGRYHGNQTSDNARNIAIIVMCTLFMLVVGGALVIHWRSGYAEGGYYSSY